MKTLLVLLLGLASSLLPFKCAKASGINDIKQTVSKKISSHIYFTNDKDAELHGKMIVEFVIDEKGKIKITAEQTSNEEFKKFVHEKLSEITFDDHKDLEGETFIIKITSERENE